MYFFLRLMFIHPRHLQSKCSNVKGSIYISDVFLALSVTSERGGKAGFTRKDFSWSRKWRSVVGPPWFCISALRTGDYGKLRTGGVQANCVNSSWTDLQMSSEFFPLAFRLEQERGRVFRGDVDSSVYSPYPRPRGVATGQGEGCKTGPGAWPTLHPSIHLYLNEFSSIAWPFSLTLDLTQNLS